MLVVTIVAWSILGIQVVYLAAFLIGLLRKRSQPNDTEPVPVSVIVCAHDEEQNLRELVPVLLSQKYFKYEVIVVEDRCNDNTFDYLYEVSQRNSQLKIVRVRFLPEHVNGKKYGLTLGIKAASYDWVLLTDADCRPVDEYWIQSMSPHFQADKQIVIGYSPYRKSEGWLNSFIRFESLLTAIQYIGSALLGGPYMGVGRNLAYRKELFLNTKGFHKHLNVIGGDDDLFVNEHATAENVAISLGAGTLMFSSPKATWKEYYYQKLRHLSVGKRYKVSDKLMLGLFSATWILSWLFVLPSIFFIEPMQTYVWVGFLVREFLLIGLIYRASSILGDPFEAWKTPFLDFNYAIYYLGTGLAALVSKRVRWKK